MNKLRAYPNNNLSHYELEKTSSKVEFSAYSDDYKNSMIFGREINGNYYCKSRFDSTWDTVNLAAKDDLGIYFTATGSKAAVYKQNVVSVSIQLKAGHTYFLVGRNGVSIPNDGPMSAVFDVSSDAGTSFHLGNSRTTMSNGGGCVTAMIIKTVKDCTVNLIGYGYVNETYNYDGRIIAIQLA